MYPGIHQGLCSCFLKTAPEGVRWLNMMLLHVLPLRVAELALVFIAVPVIEKEYSPFVETFAGGSMAGVPHR